MIGYIGVNDLKHALNEHSFARSSSRVRIESSFFSQMTRTCYTKASHEEPRPKFRRSEDVFHCRPVFWVVRVRELAEVPTHGRNYMSGELSPTYNEVPREFSFS